jgi:hypothetical protein
MIRSLTERYLDIIINVIDSFIYITISIGLGGPVLIWAWQSMHWLTKGYWFELTIASMYKPLTGGFMAPISTSMIGLNKIIDWVLYSAPLAGILFTICVIVIGCIMFLQVKVFDLVNGIK